MSYDISISVDKERMKDKKYNPMIPAYVNLYGYWNRDAKAKEIPKSKLKYFIIEKMNLSEASAARIIKAHRDMGIIESSNEHGGIYLAPFPKGEVFWKMRAEEVEYYLDNLDSFEFKLLCLLGSKWELHCLYYQDQPNFSFSGNGLSAMLGYNANSINRTKVNDSLDRLCALGLVKCSTKPHKKNGYRGLYRDLYKVIPPKDLNPMDCEYVKKSIESMLKKIGTEDKAIEQIFKTIEGKDSPHEDTD